MQTQGNNIDQSYKDNEDCKNFSVERPITGRLYVINLPRILTKPSIVTKETRLVFLAIRVRSKVKKQEQNSKGKCQNAGKPHDKIIFSSP